MGIHLDPSLIYIDGTNRVLTEQTILSQIEAVQAKLGITNITPITNLDRVSIDVCSVTRKNAAMGANPVYSGKGASDKQSRISALMEAVERCLAEAPGNNADIETPHSCKENIIDSYLNLKKQETVLNPNELILQGAMPLNTPLEWVWGTDLFTSEEILVPANAVYHPYKPPAGSNRLFRSETNGLAAGSCMEEAVLHGLLEVVERDAYSIAEYTKNTGKKILLSIEDGVPYRLYKKFTGAGVDVHLWLLPADSGIHVVLAAVDDVVLKYPTLLLIGAGAHLNPAVAVNRALTEAAQSRLVQIHGSRKNNERDEVQQRVGYNAIKNINRHWYRNKAETTTLDELENQASNKPYHNIQMLLKKLAPTSARAIIVNLSRPGIGIPVIRAIIPSYEICALDSTRFGSRVRNYMKLGAGARWKKRH
ncbi:MAG: YcaO cyclodehydratase, ATP-ad Mg2+-binding [Candidatus Argoarchaeum ethanivorans]|uniref:YcaO cyclodehydratase, ATP-ad Mg2+-binding n=1 Tax=Candidatus Argoarchaeum ethanivorans TaxID=2608793 RepID=A0A811T770_9EURY|nr:MAG: YcaO cyclodehydratase, ATP-ad Mg2+-binding [Candidatus Argoarchaeum ethanivorans]